MADDESNCAVAPFTPKSASLFSVAPSVQRGISRATLAFSEATTENITPAATPASARSFAECIMLWIVLLCKVDFAWFDGEVSRNKSDGRSLGVVSGGRCPDKSTKTTMSCVNLRWQ